MALPLYVVDDVTLSLVVVDGCRRNILLNVLCSTHRDLFYAGSLLSYWSGQSAKTLGSLSTRQLNGSRFVVLAATTLHLECQASNKLHQTVYAICIVGRSL